MFFIRFERGVYVGCNSLTIGEHSTPTSHGSTSASGHVRLINRLTSDDQFAKFRRSFTCNERRHTGSTERPSTPSRGILRPGRMWGRPYFLGVVRMRLLQEQNNLVGRVTKLGPPIFFMCGTPSQNNQQRTRLNLR